MKKGKLRRTSIAPAIGLDQRIITIRGQRVMLSPDLAEMYQVETRALIQAVKRNLGPFPGDFMFQLTMDETRKMNSLRSQFVTLKRGGHSTYAPYAFTELGVAMLSSVRMADYILAKGGKTMLC